VLKVTSNVTESEEGKQVAAGMMRLFIYGIRQECQPARFPGSCFRGWELNCLKGNCHSLRHEGVLTSRC